MKPQEQSLADYHFHIAAGLSDYEARESAFGNEWDTPADIAYRESLFASRGVSTETRKDTGTADSLKGETE